MSRFLEALQSGKVLLMDGAMGTELIRRGADIKRGTHYCTIFDPGMVETIHREYLQAGAACFLTNTFQAHPPADEDRLASADLEDANRKSARLARQVADRAFVLGSIGPLPEWWDNKKQKPARLMQRCGAQIDWLAGTHFVDALLFETQPAAEWTVDLARIVRLYWADLPVIASFVFDDLNGQPACNERPAASIAALMEENKRYVVAIGVNCGRGMDLDAILDVVRCYRQATSLPILVRPNAGSGRVADRWHYPLTPARFAERIPELVEAGATLIGGCCGTTPDHIAAAREVLEGMGVLWKDDKAAG